MSASDNLKLLIEIGFSSVGHWRMVGIEINCELTLHANVSNVLYAFVVEEELMYIGKTTQPLRQRMGGYKKPANSQLTNVRNNRNIRDCLADGKHVEVYALPDNGLLHHGPFHLNVAAGLEDSLIRELSPPWNGGDRKSISSEPRTRISKTDPIRLGASIREPRPAPCSDEFRTTLRTILSDGGRNGHEFIEISAGDLHRAVGGYPAPNHRMPICCDVMRAAMFDGDIVLSEPPKGKGASLKIRFALPRRTS